MVKSIIKNEALNATKMFSQDSINVLVFRILSFMLFSLILNGCVVSIPGKGDEANTSHHIILGFGIVSVNEPKDIALITTNTETLGIIISDRPGMKLGIGYSSNTVVTVPNEAEDVRVEVSKIPWKPFIVDTQSAILKKLKY